MRHVYKDDEGTIFPSLRAIAKCFGMNPGFVSKKVKAGEEIQGKTFELIGTEDIASQHHKKIKCVETGEEFPSIKDCAAYIAVSPNALTNHLKGRSKSCCEQHYIYVD